MYIKWITCSVNNESKNNFSNAQQQWSEIQNSKGFIGQFGGWDLNNENTACIISIWQNQISLEMFMKNMHDKIFLENNQSNYYNSVEVEHFNSFINMGGQLDSIVQILKNGKLLRIADCIVRKDRIKHFELTQKNVWFTGMKDRIGMLGGNFSQGNKNSFRYLISTFWDSIESHSKYVKEILPELENKSNVKDDILNIIERKVVLIDSWKIIK